MKKWLAGLMVILALVLLLRDGHAAAQIPADFAGRFFQPLRPEYYPRLAGIVSSLEKNDKHTIFAALVSAALKQNLSADFTGTYHYPLNSTLFTSAFTAFSQILDPPYQVYLPILLR